MSKIIWLAVIGCVFLAVWQGASGLIESSRLEGVMGDAAEGARGSEEPQIKEDLLRRAESAEIPLRADQIAVQITLAPAQGPAASMVEARGVQNMQKRVQIKAQHTYRILGLQRTRELTAARTFTVAATVTPSRNYDAYAR